MKIIVIIFAALAILFAGGCLLAGGGRFGPLALALFLILALNAGAIIAGRDASSLSGWFLILFGIADFALAAFLLFFSGLAEDRYVGGFVFLAVLLIVVKGGVQIASGVGKVRDVH